MFGLPFLAAAALLFLMSASSSTALATIETMELKMPHSHPTQPETYLCTSLKLERDDPTRYIVGFKPKATSKTAHHMLLYGCKTPGSHDAMFNCGAMTVKQAGLSSSSHPCGEGRDVVYAWAQNAPELNLPEGVAFRVGKGTEIDYLVLQVHYASVAHIPSDGDVSGVEIEYTYLPQPRSAGVMFQGTNGRIPAKSTTYMEVACELTDDQLIHPFAYRVHTHALGRVVSGWKVQNKNAWNLVGKTDPQKPQMFYPVDDDTMTMTRGDILAARCTMVNDKNHAVWVGSTREDEMCNFYMMYWVDGPDIMSQKSCFSVGPPIYTWGGWLMGGGLSNIPDNEASSL